MIRLLLVLGILFSAIYLIRWFLSTPAKTVASRIKKSLWLLLGLGLIFLGITGRLNIFAALLGGTIPWIAHHLPNIMRILGFAKSIQNAQAAPPPKAQSNMSLQEAYKVLGLQASASQQEVIDAHKRLAQKVHPDKGGSDHLIQQINQAKDILLKSFH